MADRIRKIAILLTIIAVLFWGCGKEPTGDGGNDDDEPDWEDDIGVMWQLTSLPGDETNPTWAPDGSTIAFEWEIDWPPEIYLIPADGGNVTKLTYEGGSNPCWSPDGSLILFDDSVYDDTIDDYQVHLFVVDTNGGPPTPITEGEMQYAFDPCWSPDMSKIAFGGKNQYVDYFDDSALFTMGFPEGEPEIIAFGGLVKMERFSQVTWSYDGTMIAYYYYWEGDPLIDDPAYELRIISPDGSNKSTLFTVYDPQPSWSPDSTKIAYSDHAHEPYKYYDIFVYSINEKKKTRVTDTTYNAETPSWSPDGKKIAFANKIDENADYDIWIVELNE